MPFQFPILIETDHSNQNVMSKKMILILVFLVNTVICAKDSSDETKYIDLLPDKEKEDFLETIARRIFNSVQSKDDRHKDSEEASETQLDEQDEYIKKLIEDESSNLRKSVDIESKNENDVDFEIRKGDDNIHEDDVDHERIKDADDNLEIRKDDEPVEVQIYKHDDDLHLLEKHELDDDDIQLDLTLREGKRNKRNISFEHEQSNEDSKIIHISTGNLNGDENIPSKDESDREDIQIKHFKRVMPGILNELDKTTQSSNAHNMTQMIDFDAETDKDIFEENDATPEDNDRETTTDSVNSEGIVNDNENINDDSTTQKIYESINAVSPEAEKSSFEKEPATEVIKDPITFSNNVNRTDVIVSNENLSSVIIKKEVINSSNNAIQKDENVKISVPILRSFLEDETMYAIKETVTKTGTEESLEKTKYIDEVSLPTVYSKNNRTITSKFLENSTNYDEQTVASITIEFENSDTASKVEDETFLVTDDYSKHGTAPDSGTTAVPASTTSSITNKEMEINPDIEVTTLKTEAFTKASLRSETDSDEKLLGNKNIALQNNKIESNNSVVKDRIELDSAKNIANILKNNISVKDDNIKSGSEIDKKSYNLANDMIKILRQDLLPEVDSNEKNFNSLKALYETTKPKQYKVYEVPLDKQPFVQKDRLSNQENPYVPIYDYSPQNAFYNPHNRLGPNADSKENLRSIINLDDINDGENSDRGNDNDLHTSKRDRAESDASYELIRDDNKDLKSILKSLRSNANENQRKFRFGFRKPKTHNSLPYKLNLPVIVNYPKYTDIYLNPNDYLDMDYYYGRSKNPNLRNRCDLEHSDESNKGHLNEIDEEDSLKNHMRAVRMMLYRQKHFGYVPSVNSTEVKSEEVSKYANITEVLRSRPESEINDGTTQSTKNIAMDYFFGRMSEDANYPETRSNEFVYSTNKWPKKYKKNIPKNDFRYPTFKEKKYKTIQDNKVYNNNEYRNKNHRNQWNRLYDILKKTNVYVHPNKNNVGSNNFDYKKKSKEYGNNYFNDELRPATPAYKDIPVYITRAKKKEVHRPDFEAIHKILNIVDAADLLPTLDKLLKLNLTRNKAHVRSGVEEDVKPYEMVLEEMVTTDAKALQRYDWLGTTVDIQAALSKIMDMIDALRKKHKLSNLDLQLLKYSIYLHKSVQHTEKNLLRKTKLLPRNKNKKKGFLKESGLYNRNWLYRMLIEATMFDKSITKEDLNSFDDFLNDVQFYLYDLHLAIKEIATITKYKSQKWYENLKQLYLDAKRKAILEVLLHVTITRLLDLIEESAKHGLEDDFLTYAMKNEKEIERTKAELVFALKVIEELKRIGTTKILGENQ